MPRWIFPAAVLTLIVSAALYGATPAHALGGYLTNPYSQIAPAEVKAFITFDGHEETIVASQTFNFNPLVAWNFAWLIALPSEPEVTFLKDDSFFVSRDRMTRRQVTKDSLINNLLYFDVDQEDSLPVDTFSRPIDFILYKTFPLDHQYADLQDWLYRRGYILPKTSIGLVKSYAAKRWHLIAVEVNGNHIEYIASDSLHVKTAHTLPLKLKFRTDQIIYPTKLLSIQPDIDSEAVPIAYQYGSTNSEQILGVEDSQVDAVTATESAFKYPHMPLDLANVKIDLFVETDHRVTAPGFTTSYAGPVTENGRHRFLTRLFAYRPMSQVDDITFTTVDSRRVNSDLTIPEKALRIGLMIIAVIALIRFTIYESLNRRRRR